MSTHLRAERSEESQQVAPFTGEGAYHGSSKARARPAAPRPPDVPEMTPSTLARYAKAAAGERVAFARFRARFPDLYEVKRTLPVPAQEEVRADAVTFVWCPFEEARGLAGPLTRTVLDAMEPFLERRKRFVYVDSKLQFFRQGDLPVDSQLWHVDGTIAVRDQRSLDLGYPLLHDMRARMLGPAAPPTYLVYQSSHHCATQFVTEPVELELPDFLTSFDLLDRLVRELDPARTAQPAGSIVRFDGLSLHRAVPAEADGWRLWLRVVETDREARVDPSVISCYGTVFRGGRDRGGPPRPSAP